MFEHTKRQVKVFFFQKCVYIFLCISPQFAFCFFLGYERSGFDLGLQSSFFFMETLLITGLSVLKMAVTVYEREIYLGCTLPPKLSLNASPDCEFALNVE